MKLSKIAAFSLAALLSIGSFYAPVSRIAPKQTVSVSAADEVPEGYIGIYTIDDLYGIRNNLSGKYILMNDIDLSATAPGGDWDSGNGWKPIGDTSSGAFRGTFDGNGHAVRNMHIYGTLDVNEKYVGLFGYCSRATLTKIALIDCDIDVTVPNEMLGCYIGGICGNLSNSNSNISKSYATGTIKAEINGCSSGSPDYYVGGIVGTGLQLENAFNLCDISVNFINPRSSSSHYVGGVAGKISYIGRYLYNAGTVSYAKDENAGASYYVGNVAGYAFTNSIFSSCYYLKTLSNYAAEGHNLDSYYSDVAGLTVGQMKSQSAFNFDFDTIWTINPDADYPYPTLQEVPYASGSPSQPTTEPSQPSTNPSSAPKKGDINEDGFINAVDAAIILRYITLISTGYDVSIEDLY